MISKIWKEELKRELPEGELTALLRKMDKEYRKKTLFPPKNETFKVFETDPGDVRCVILGQDPYPNKGQAMGLAFSVKDGVKTPRSLVNIYKEIQSEYGYKIPDSGNLADWQRQGVFLLNASLCVPEGDAGAYMDDWKPFTDAVIRILDRQMHPIVFMLWGGFAGKKEALIKNPIHLILKAPHPSPLSASKGFFGCGHFKACNAFLEENGICPIDWRITSKNP